MIQEIDRLKRRVKLLPTRQALLEKRLPGVLTPQSKTAITIPNRPVQKMYPLSFSQERFWFLTQLTPDSCVYNRPLALRLVGSLNLRALEQTLDAILDRHEVLQATFITAADGQPVQVIKPPEPLTLSVIDLGKLPPAERETKAIELAKQEAQRPFDLAQGPLLRATLFHLDDESYVLLLVLHHVAFDAWSARVLLKEFSILYPAFVVGQDPPLPELPIQYADFAHWQHQTLQGEKLKKLLAWWKTKLAGAPPALDLPTDYPRLATQTEHGAQQSLRLSATLVNALKALGKQEKVTLFMILLAAFQTLLYRYTSQEDVVVGSPVAGRTHVEVEGLIGAFINTLVLRTDLSGNPTFRELLARVRQVVLEAYAHQDLPFEKLVEELQPARDLSRPPLFQVLFNFEQGGPTIFETQNLRMAEFTLDSGVEAHDLTVKIVAEGEELQCLFSYKTDLFDQATITRMLGHFQTLLTGVVADPEISIGTLALLTEAERQQLLLEWNDSQAVFFPDTTMQQLFEAQVVRHSQVPAVIFENQSLTYNELNERANQLAHYLRKLGVGPEVFVGLCVERSIEMIVGVMGILKAGGAYVPLDPVYPQERLDFMLADTQASVLLTQHRLLNRLPDDRAKIICLDTDWETIIADSKKGPENPVSGATANNLAYIIYTSGSTGRPKGVQIIHKSLVNYVQTIALEFDRKPGDRVLQFASLSFDTSAEEIFPCLATGGTIVLRTDEMLSSVSTFLERCQEWRVTALHPPTSYWHEMVVSLAEGDVTWPDQLRTIYFGGERVLPERVAAWQEMMGNRVRLVNGYGPTEATIVATMYDLTERTDVITSGREIPIGRPMPNYQAYILDKYLNPTPIGVPGELHIGGVGLARGYLNRPNLTAEKFISNPFSDDPQARLYKTGDLTRYLPDGNIEFLGRIDNQVKIRGFRIELNEIEAVLGQHPAIRENVVLAREDTPGQPRLVAYLVATSESELTTSELRHFLMEKLPEHMVPSAFVWLDALPLTPNDKIDRRALPAPDQSRPGLDNNFLAPRTPIEKKLAGIWANVLGLEQVGIRDSFFELGGHSLLAIRLFTQIEQLTGRKFPLATIFQTPTVEQFAKILADDGWTPSWSSLVPIQPKGSRPPFFFVHAQGGNVVGYYDLAHYLGSDQPFYGLQAQGLAGTSSPFRRFEDMAGHYIKEIRTVQPRGPYYVGGWCLGGYVALEMARQLQAGGEEVALVVMLESPHPDYPKYLPGIGTFRRHFYQVIARLDLEISNFLEVEFGKKFAYCSERLSRLANNVRLKVEGMRSTFARKPPSIKDPSQIQIQKTVDEAHIEAYQTYRPQPYAGLVAGFRAAKQPLGIYPDPTLGWGELIKPELVLQEVPGHHIGLLVEPRVRITAAQMRDCLDKALKKSNGCVSFDLKT